MRDQRDQSVRNLQIYRNVWRYNGHQAEILYTLISEPFDASSFDFMFCSECHLEHGSGFASFIIYETLEGRLTRCRLVISIFKSDPLAKDVSTAYQGHECGGFRVLPALDLYLMTFVTNTHVRGPCVRSRRLEMCVYRSRLVFRQSSHLPLAALAE